MKTRILLQKALWALAGVVAAHCASANVSVRYEQGNAWNLQRTQLLYTESHWLQFEDGRLQERTVLYRCVDGTAFARKNVSYRNSAVAPEFSFFDRRLDYQEGLSRKNNRASLWYQKGGERSEQTLTATSNLVADSGFDAFIKSRWQQLNQARALPLQFAVPARLKSYGFILERSGETRYMNTAARNFTLGLDGWLGLFAPDIQVTYSLDGQRLLRFKGVSNILANDGKTQINAQIEFPLTDQTVAETEKRQAQSVLLKSCQLRT